MIQFNLLPKVKLDFVKAKRTQRLTILAAVIVSAISLAVFVLLLTTTLALGKHSKDLSTDIKRETTKLNEVKDLNKIITIQSQLNSLPSLHDSKPVATRLFDFVKKTTPQNVTIESFDIDFSQEQAGTIKVTGAANALSSINVFVDTLKFTTYKTADGKTANAFSDVIMTFSTTEKGASYDISLKFDPVIYAGTSTVELIVPAAKVTTRSETEKPEAVFQSNNTEDQGN
ncbi:hypothetical protein KA068_00070 [Candidatus Saccharibacteria bacterium]|nr:hypothetical protein [Candidatus Saccharibacteria bacterium]